MSLQNALSGQYEENGAPSGETADSVVDLGLITSQIANVFHLTRFLMGQNPWAAETFHALSQRQELAEAIERGEGIVQYVLPNEPTAYIVVRDGTRFTTTIRPKWARDADIQVVHVDVSEPLLLPGLEQACQKVQEASPEAEAGLGISKMQGSISSYYSREIPTSIADQIRIMEAFGNITRTASLGDSSEEVLEWACECRQALRAGYLKFRLAGDTIIAPLATFYFFEIAPISAEALLAAGLDETGTGSLKTLASGIPRLSPLPSFNLEFYFVHLIVHGVPGVAQAAVSLARNLQEGAEKLCHSGRRQPGFERFHMHLFEALLYSRCAQFILNILLSLEKRFKGVIFETSSLLEEAARLRYICEETRVQIMVSLGSFHRPDVLVLGDAYQFWNWLLNLKDNAFLSARMRITDLTIRLMLPDFLADIAKGWLLLNDPASFNRGHLKFLQVATLLEEHLAQNILMGESNYLTSLYAQLANALERVGRQEEARDLYEKAQPKYIQALMDANKNWLQRKSAR